MVKLFNFKLKKENWQLVLEPKRLVAFSISRHRGSSKIDKRIEIAGDFVFGERLMAENLLKAIDQINQKNQVNEAGLSLNLPNFFTKIISIQNVDPKNFINILTLKVQNEVPISLDRYFWTYQRLYSQNDFKKFLLVFYQHNIIDDINNSLIHKQILPLIVEPSFLSLLRYLQTKVSFTVDNAYIVLIISNSVIITITYENNQIQNVFSESINPDEAEMIVNRTLTFLTSKLTLPLANILFMSDINLPNLEQSNSKIINLKNITANNADEIFGIGLFERTRKFPKDTNELSLNQIKPVQEFTLTRIVQAIYFWIIFLILSASIINVFLFYFNKTLKINNKDFSLKTNQLTQTAGGKNINSDQLRSNLNQFLTESNQLIDSKKNYFSYVDTVENSSLKPNLAKTTLTNDSLKFTFTAGADQIPNLRQRIQQLLPSFQINQGQNSSTTIEASANF
ncbi:MAG: hypothetical protein M1505_00385 [Patescibacteria group bacterium]|nr:hypothetical protein [Patescibacteria group bacterium]